MRRVDGLLENMKWAVTIGIEDHRFAIRCPGCRVIQSLVECQTPWLAEPPFGAKQICNVYIGLWSVSSQRHSLCIRADAELDGNARTARNPYRWADWACSAAIELHGP